MDEDPRAASRVPAARCGAGITRGGHDGSGRPNRSRARSHGPAADATLYTRGMHGLTAGGW